MFLLAIQIIMSETENGSKSEERSHIWSELEIPELLYTEKVREVHTNIRDEWDYLQQSACQTAAGRALWKHVIHDPLADLLAGETQLRNVHEKIKKDCLNNAREVSGVILAVRTLWFDSRIQAGLDTFRGGASQVVLLGAGMDARSYRLNCLKDTDVFEVDFPNLLLAKTTLIQAATDSNNNISLTARSLVRVAADVRENDWLEKLHKSGFVPEKNTIWVLEGILYYLSQSKAMQILKIIAEKCAETQTILLADFMNKPSTMLPNSVFHFYCDWPDHLLPSLGFSHVKLSQIGDADANFGLVHDPLNLFNKLRRLPRSTQTHPDDGTLCCRLYLVEASSSPSLTLS